MAYLDLSLAGAVRAGTALPAVPIAAPVPDPPERAAVLWSLRERRRTIAIARLSRFAARALLRMPDEQVFASERLEAIRRYAIRYRIEGAELPAAEDALLRSTGVTELEAVGLRTLVDEASSVPTRGARRPRLATLLGWFVLAAVPAVAAASLYVWLAAQLDDRLGALVVSIILVIGLVSPVALAGHPTRSA